MTFANCERLLAHYDAARQDRTLTEQARLNAESAYADMLANIERRRAAGHAPQASKKSSKS